MCISSNCLIKYFYSYSVLRDYRILNIISIQYLVVSKNTHNTIRILSCCRCWARASRASWSPWRTCTARRPARSWRGSSRRARSARRTSPTHAFFDVFSALVLSYYADVTRHNVSLTHCDRLFYVVLWYVALFFNWPGFVIFCHTKLLSFESIVWLSI